MKLAARMADIPPFHVMELGAKAEALEAAGRKVVHFEVGEPAFATAAPIVEAAQRFLAAGHVHYTGALGILPLRQAIAGFYQQRHGMSIDPQRIIVTAGASGALLLALASLVSPGDEWLLPDPGYPCNRNFVRLVEGVPRQIAVGPETNYQLTPEHLRLHWNPRTCGVMLASPSNPTGSVLTGSDIAAVWEAVSAHGGALIVDEIYHGLTYGMEAETALAVDDEIVLKFATYVKHA